MPNFSTAIATAVGSWLAMSPFTGPSTSPAANASPLPMLPETGRPASAPQEERRWCKKEGGVTNRGR